MYPGANLLLQRIMVKRGIPEDMTFIAFDSTTSLCESSYVSKHLTVCHVDFFFLNLELQQTFCHRTLKPSHWIGVKDLVSKELWNSSLLSVGEKLIRVKINNYYHSRKIIKTMYQALALRQSKQENCRLYVCGLYSVSKSTFILSARTIYSLI